MSYSTCPCQRTTLSVDLCFLLWDVTSLACCLCQAGWPWSLHELSGLCPYLLMGCAELYMYVSLCLVARQVLCLPGHLSSLQGLALNLKAH